MKISTKAALIFLAAGLLPLAGISLLGFDRLRALAVDKAQTEIRQESLRMAEAVDNWMNDNRRMMMVLAKNPQVVGAARARAPLDVVGTLTEFNAEYKWHTVVFVSDPAGQQIARSDQVGLVKMGHQPAAQRVLRDGEPYADSAVIGTADGVPSILFVSAIKAPGSPSPELLGIAGARSTVGDITRIVTPRRKENDAGGVLAMLATPKGEVLVHSGFTADKKQSNVIKDAPEFAAAGAATGLVRFDGPAGPMLGYSARTERGWILLYALPEAQVLAPALRVAQIFALISVAALALFALIAWSASRAIARPITQLARVADRVSKGELNDVELSHLERRHDEIGELAHAVSRLVISFKAAMTMLKKRQAA